MRFVLNGVGVELDVHPLARLLDVIREHCGVTSAKEGCGEGECGACTVLVDGVPVNSCLVPVLHVGGCQVTTVEGLEADALKRAFVAEGAAQCGICTPGMVVMASCIPAAATAAEIRQWLAGNLCRCTGYGAIVRAVQATGDHASAPKG